MTGPLTAVSFPSPAATDRASQRATRPMTGYCDPIDLVHVACYRVASRHLAQWAVFGCLVASGSVCQAAPGFAGIESATLQRLQQAAHHHPVDRTDRGGSSNAPADHDTRRPRLSSSQAARIAQDHVGGRVLNVLLEQGPTGPYYLVKILNQGRVRVVRVDAAP